jgi:hypothetical protein
MEASTSKKYCVNTRQRKIRQQQGNDLKSMGGLDTIVINLLAGLLVSAPTTRARLQVVVTHAPASQGGGGPRAPIAMMIEIECGHFAWTPGPHCVIHTWYLFGVRIGSIQSWWRDRRQARGLDPTCVCTSN